MPDPEKSDRTRDDMADLMQQIDDEAHAEGPDSVAELQALTAWFKLIVIDGEFMEVPWTAS